MDFMGLGFGFEHPNPGDRVFILWVFSEVLITEF
jgi:hypothetical protein